MSTHTELQENVSELREQVNVLTGGIGYAVYRAVQLNNQEAINSQLEDECPVCLELLDEDRQCPWCSPHNEAETHTFHPLSERHPGLIHPQETNPKSRRPTPPNGSSEEQLVDADAEELLQNAMHLQNTQEGFIHESITYTIVAGLVAACVFGLTRRQP